MSDAPALAATGGVITSASAVLVGVLLDTIVVRSVLVTALTMDLDRRIWWPSRLSKPAADPAREPVLAPRR